MITTRPKIGRSAAGFLLAALLTFPGCADPTSSGGFATVSGRVTTQDGMPVAGAAILVGYRPSFADRVPPRQEISLQPKSINPDNILWFGVTDTCGDTIRVICADPCTSSTLSWDGETDDGKKVLDGLYTMVMTLKPDTLSNSKTFESDVFLFTEYPRWDPSMYTAPHASSGNDGTFSFNDDCLGFGETVVVGGEEETEILITRWIDLLAVHPDGRQVWVDSTFVSPLGSVEVDIVIPD